MRKPARFNRQGTSLMTEPTASHNPVRGAAADIVASTSRDIHGTVRVAPAVLLELVDLTVADIAGVVALRALRKSVRKADDRCGRAWDNGKVSVHVDGDRIGVDLALAVRRGTNIAELSREIQRRVGIAVGDMLGMTVRTVNIYVEDIVEPAAG